MDATTVRVSAFAGFAAIILDFASQLFSNAQAFSGGSNFRMLLSITAAAFCLSFILHLRAFVVRAQVRGKTFLQLSALALILSILVLMIAWLVAIWMSSNFAIASTGATWLVYFVWGGT